MSKIQLRKDTAANWLSANPTLAAGEFGFETDTNKGKIGDGLTDYNSLAYFSGSGGGGGGSSTFVGLSDTPAGFAGSSGNLALVNSGETAMEFSNQVGLLGVGSAPDATNKFSVSSPASLLNHEGSGHQVKINKNTVGDTASFLFQTGFSGRAELGTTGDDDFHFKVSPDGTTWKEAILVDKDTGEVTFPNTTLVGGGGLTYVESSPIVMSGQTSNLAYVFAHGLGAMPRQFGKFLECNTANNGYSVGDRINWNAYKQSGIEATLSADATNVTLAWDNRASQTNIVPKGGGNFVALNVTEWELILWAEGV